MRIFLLFFPVFFFCGLLHAQTVKVEYGGDPLPGKDRKKIEQFLQHEVDFYSQFGLPDTLSLQLYVFENRREAINYLESINVSLPIKASGAYLSLIHISEPTRRTPISYAVFCLKKKKQYN